MEKFNELEWYKETLSKLIKPCPICGAEKPALRLLNKEGKEIIKCFNCGLKLEKAIGVGVVQSWNNRVDC